jgi:hypothetical protein
VVLTAKTVSDPSETADHSPGPAAEAVKMSSLLKLPEVVTTATGESCFALSERVVAAESVCFVAQVPIYFIFANVYL